MADVLAPFDQIVVGVTDLVREFGYHNAVPETGFAYGQMENVYRKPENSSGVVATVLI